MNPAERIEPRPPLRVGLSMAMVDEHVAECGVEGKPWKGLHNSLYAILSQRTDVSAKNIRTRAAADKAHLGCLMLDEHGGMHGDGVPDEFGPGLAYTF